MNIVLQNEPMKNTGIGLFWDGCPFGGHVLQALQEWNLPPLFIIRENRKNNILRRARYRGKKYGWISTLIWAADAFATQKGDRPVPDHTFLKGVEILEVDNINDPLVLALLRRNSPRLILNTLSVIIRKEILELPSQGVFGFHPGILPKYIGLSSIFWQIYDGKMPGFSIFRLTAEMDSGPAYLQKIIGPLKKERLHRYCRRFHYEGAKELARLARLAITTDHYEPLSIGNDDPLDRGLISLPARIRVEKNWKKLTG